MWCFGDVKQRAERDKAEGIEVESTGINTPPNKDDDRMLWQSRFNLKSA